MKKLLRRLREVEIAPVGPAEDPKAKTAAAGAKEAEPLHKRVIKRAELIRNRWKDIPTPSAVRRAAVGRRKEAQAEGNEEPSGDA